MPFPIVYGIPDNTPRSLLLKLRESIISAVSGGMGCSPDIVSPFFPADLLGQLGENQADVIYCRLDTGMFYDKPNTMENLAVRKNTTTKVAEAIWDAYGGKYEVEVFLGDLNHDGRTLIHKKKQE